MNKVTLEESRVNNQARKKFRVELPNVVDDLKLRPCAFRLYVHMRRVAGQSGECWQSTKTLAAACNMSTGSVSTAKKELLRRRPELGGVSLITERPTTRSSDCFGVTDIWDHNLARYSKVKTEVHILNDGSLDERTVQQMNGNIHNLNDGRPHTETKKEHCEKRTPEEGTIEEFPTTSPNGDEKGHKFNNLLLIEESLLRKLKILIPVTSPMYKNQKVALRKLAEAVVEGKCIEDDIILCAEDLIENKTMVAVNPVNLLNHLGTFLAQSYDGKPHGLLEYMHQSGNRVRPELYDYDCSCCEWN